MNLQRSYTIFRQGRAHLNNYCKYLSYRNIKTLEKTSFANCPKRTELSTRYVSTCEVKSVTEKESFMKRLVRKIPFFNVDKTIAKAAAYLLYESIADKVNYLDFFEKFEMPDTFYSWFVITELHIWMLSVRTMADGDEGRFIRNCLVEALWNDVAQRVKKLGGGHSTIMKQQIMELSEQLQASLIAYDEGLQSGDTVLAGALWRRLYQHNYTDASHLEQLVRYVRRHITLLENISKDRLLKEKSVNWEPFK